MNQEEHLSTARELLQRAYQERQDGGNDMIAAELLWGAFAHCLISVALNDSMAHDSHGAFRIIARHLDNVHHSNEWSSTFGAAERLHFHFYHANLLPAQLNSHTRDTESGTIHLLELL